MKKRLFSGFLALLLIFCCVTPAIATNAKASVLASWYLDQYGVGVSTASNHRIAVTVNVDGTGVMTRIGVQQLYIEQKVNGVWKEFDTLYGAEHPEFYEYNSIDYFDVIYFTGTPGVQYRVTVTAFAMNSTGFDTGKVVSSVITCK